MDIITKITKIGMDLLLDYTERKHNIIHILQLSYLIQIFSIDYRSVMEK